MSLSSLCRCCQFGRTITLVLVPMLTIVLFALILQPASAADVQLKSGVKLYEKRQPASAADVQLKSGVHFYEKRQYAAALGEFKKVGNTPSHVTALYYQALCEQQLGHRDKGDAILHEIISKYPSSPEAAPANDYFIARASNAELASIQRTSPAPSVTRASGSSAGHGYAMPNNCVVPFRRGSGGHLYVRVTLNGRPVEVMFDTGAEACMISKNQLTSSGVSYQPSGNIAAVRGVGATTLPAEMIMFDTGLGDIMKSCPFLVVSNYSIDPLLGQAFFRDYQYQIDAAAGVIRFTKAGSPAAAGGYDSIDVPYKSVGQEMLVQAKVDGHDCPMFFDTGAFTNLFPARVWVGMGLSIPSNAERIQTGGVGGNAPGFKFRINRLELGAVSKSGVEVVVADTQIPFPLLGQEFFRDRQFTIDSTRHVIRFVH
ncbi:MAG: retroviral-like aspartic protease family protein [Candidatus Obscuribacterales bacterium]|nr:retroviral-like aspartic protease family protein [Candidatus Obscuribacterales bacterium]